MPNELSKGTRRAGDLYDMQGGTSVVKVTLERSDSGISVTVPWSGPNDPHAAWFVGDNGLLPGMESQVKRRSVPKRVLFHDSHGSVLLIRCRAQEFHSLFRGPGSGTLRTQTAILNVQEDKEFDYPHGLQTEISGLREWLGVTSWDAKHVTDGDEYMEVISSKKVSPFEVIKHGEVTLEFHAGWGVLPYGEPDRRILLDHLRCVTRSAEPADWDVHMQFHRAIRDLLVISRWRSESCVVRFALRDDDPETTLNEVVYGDLWREVVVSDDARKTAPKGYHPHLILYSDLDLEGIRRWLAIRDNFSRALNPVITSIDLHETTPQTRLAHTGPGLEALGYLLMIRDGNSVNKASSASLRSRFERILEDVGECLPFDGATWVTQTANVYNSLKHANRSLPDEVDVINSWADSVMVVRAWVARELGLSADVVRERLEDDPQPREYFKISDSRD